MAGKEKAVVKVEGAGTGLLLRVGPLLFIP